MSPAVVTSLPELWRGILPRATFVPDAETLSLVPGTHDLVIHDMALHWANDPVGQLVQCRHALVPDGLLVATLFGGETLQDLRISLAEAEIAITGGLSPRVAPMGEIRDLGGLLQRAGLALPVADVDTFHVSYAGMTALMLDLRGMGETNVMSERLRRPTRRGIFAEAARILERRRADSEGRISARFDVITLTGWAPAASQPQPLRPGTATHRLAEALNTKETPLDPQGG